MPQHPNTTKPPVPRVAHKLVPARRLVQAFEALMQLLVAEWRNIRNLNLGGCVRALGQSWSTTCISLSAACLTQNTNENRRAIRHCSGGGRLGAPPRPAGSAGAHVSSSRCGGRRSTGGASPNPAQTARAAAAAAGASGQHGARRAVRLHSVGSIRKLKPLCRHVAVQHAPQQHRRTKQRQRRGREYNRWGEQQRRAEDACQCSARPRGRRIRQTGACGGGVSVVWGC